jgi:hypothetical protein
MPDRLGGGHWMSAFLIVSRSWNILGQRWLILNGNYPANCYSE